MLSEASPARVPPVHTAKPGDDKRYRVANVAHLVMREDG
jgi:hypothetical protein